MNTIKEKLEQLNCLYQERINAHQELRQQIEECEQNEDTRDTLDKSLHDDRMTFIDTANWMGLLLVVGLNILVIKMGAYTLGIKVFIGICAIESMVLVLGIDVLCHKLEKKGILEKIQRIFHPKKYAKLDELNLSLEKVDIEQLKQQLEDSIQKEEKCRLDLQAFQREAEALANIPSEEEIMLEQQRKLEEREQNKMNFFQTHVLTEEEAIRLNSVIDQEEIGPQKKMGEMK